MGNTLARFFDRRKGNKNKVADDGIPIEPFPRRISWMRVVFAGLLLLLAFQIVGSGIGLTIAYLFPSSRFITGAKVQPGADSDRVAAPVAESLNNALPTVAPAVAGTTQKDPAEPPTGALYADISGHWEGAYTPYDSDGTLVEDGAVNFEVMIEQEPGVLDFEAAGTEVDDGETKYFDLSGGVSKDKIEFKKTYRGDYSIIEYTGKITGDELSGVYKNSFDITAGEWVMRRVVAE